MAYCTQQDLVDTVGGDRISQLTDFEKTLGGGHINTARVTAACEAASSLIDSYAAKRYSVPFAAPSATIKRMAVRFAIYDLIEQSSVGPTGEQIAEQGIRLKWLEDLAGGKVTPGTDPLPGAHSMVVDKAVDRPATKEVSRLRTKGYW